MITLRNIKRVFSMGQIEVNALARIDLDIQHGEFVAVMGASGSGKSTLMNILGCLDRATSGDYYLEGVHVNDLNKRDLARVRNKKIGFVFQGFNLLPRTSALENVLLPLLYNRDLRSRDLKPKAMKALDAVALTDRIHHEPSQLSGGQQQRVAIARALVNEPSLILADEPTGNLDSRTSIEVMSVLQSLNNRGITIVLVTHEPDISLYANRIIELKDGRIIRDVLARQPRNAAADMSRLDKDKVGTPQPGSEPVTET
ncbi:ABC transporter ATP-binding protein [bacterium]|nr:ABC transporter ATP-binding protein [candidate division CSSED10-310 bacterium]